MKPYSVLVIALCIFSASAEDSSIIPQGLGDVINIFYECRSSDGLAPCLKMKALNLIDRVSRMEKITLLDGVEIKGNPAEKSNEPSLEEEEKTLPRSIDAKDQALTNMIINRLSKMIGSKTIEISVPRLIETARKEEEEGIFEKFGGGESSGGGGGGGKESKKEEKEKGMFMQMFIGSLLAKKIAMLPLYLGALFILALKALITSKIALLIVGIIVVKKLLASKHQGGGGGTAVHHISAGHGGGYEGGHGGWSGGGGGGWDGGWGRRSFDEAQKLAFKSQKPT